MVGHEEALETTSCPWPGQEGVRARQRIFFCAGGDPEETHTNLRQGLGALSLGSVRPALFSKPLALEQGSGGFRRCSEKSCTELNWVGRRPSYSPLCYGFGGQRYLLLCLMVLVASDVFSYYEWY